MLGRHWLRGTGWSLRYTPKERGGGLVIRDEGGWQARWRAVGHAADGC
jgi:hypothetical protein